MLAAPNAAPLCITCRRVARNRSSFLFMAYYPLALLVKFYFVQIRIFLARWEKSYFVNPLRHVKNLILTLPPLMIRGN